MVNEVSSAVSVHASLSVPTSSALAGAKSQVNPVKAVEPSGRQEPVESGKIMPPKDQTLKPESEVVDVNDAVKQLRDHMKNLDRELEFSVDEDSGRTVITGRDPETDEGVRQIPPDELLYVVRAMEENSSNLFVEAKA